MSPLKTAAICSHCLRGQHAHCTVPDTCGCETCNPPAVVWEDPPTAIGRQQGSSKSFPVAELKANPKRWAKVETHTSKSAASSTRSRFKKGSYGEVAPPHFEARACRLADGKGSALYMRYVGPDGKA